jgi:predicted dehydrogenase
MVGGGAGAFIGAVHRMAARLDDAWELTAGAFQSDPVASRAFGLEMGLPEERCYPSFQVMAQAEAGRADRIDAVAICAPNHVHAPAARAFLETGTPVICDKPLAISREEAEALEELVRRTGLPFILTHNYSGYPMVREARHLVSSGALGAIRVVQAEYAQDWLSVPLEDNKQAQWRGDPARAGPGGALGDIATHAFHLCEFITGLETQEVSAELTTFVPGRRLDDNAQILLRYKDGARGSIWASQVAVGAANGLRIRIFGDRAALDWSQETPEELRVSSLGEAPRILRRGTGGLSQAAMRATRLPAGHPEGYLEGFAQIYSDAAELVRARTELRPPDPLAALAPSISDGVRGVRFIHASVASSRKSSQWTRV